MLKVENIVTYGWEAAIRGMRNPMNSWEKSDSCYSIDKLDENYTFIEKTTDGLFSFYIGPNDKKLMLDLCKGGPVHAKFRRMLTITMDITAPLYWWKEFDTYKVGTVANSCSTMHKIHDKEFELSDFSFEHFDDLENPNTTLFEDDKYFRIDSEWLADAIISTLNKARRLFLETKDKKYWWQMIQLLPSSYNQKRTVQLNYEVAHNIYISRKDHKLDEWHTLCDVLKELPMSELITGEE